MILDRIIQKEVKGNNEEDFVELQQIENTYVLLQKRTMDKETFCIKKIKTESFGGIN